jgi:hypothetical protein
MRASLARRRWPTAPPSHSSAAIAGFQSHRWEGGILPATTGATLVSGFWRVSLTDNLKLELSVGQFLGNLSNGYLPTWGSPTCSCPNGASRRS